MIHTNGMRQDAGNGSGSTEWQQPLSNRVKRALPVIALLLFLVIFCLLNGGAGWLRGALGFRNRTYDREQVIAVWRASEFEDNAALLPTLERIRENDGSLRTFKTGKQALERHADKILTQILRENYDYYAGNSAELTVAQKRYPSMHLLVLIPERDFEAVAYRLFGGTYSIKHGNYGAFVYLESASAYTTAAQIPLPNEFEPLSIQRIEETEHSYRVYIDVENESSGGNKRLIAHFIKREDGTAYLDSLVPEKR